MAQAHTADLNKANRLIASIKAAQRQLDTLSVRYAKFAQDMEVDLSDLGVTMDKLIADATTLPPPK